MPHKLVRIRVAVGLLATVLVLCVASCDRQSELEHALQRMRITLPETASNPYIKVSQGMTYVVFLRFDMDSAQVEPFLEIMV